MIVELVTFEAPEGASWDDILADARATVPRWSANPALLRKHYLLTEDGKRCAGLYIWPDRAAAEAAHDEQWQANVAKRTGSRPTIAYFQLQMMLDNESRIVTEWSQSGTPVSQRLP